MRKCAYLAVAAAALALLVGPTIANAQTPAAPVAPTTVILKGSPLGGVKFNHTLHQKAAADKCETCHHASKPEKPQKAKQEKCQNCHTTAAVAPMKTITKLAFHDATAKAGLCVDCHLKAPKGKVVPASAKCLDCHKKENK
jgi:hypothetical protein